MKIYQGLTDKKLKTAPRAAAIGIFDGVHRGHRKILKSAMESARRNRQRSMVITFEPHPSRVLSPAKKEPLILMSLAHRLKFFEKMGVDEALVIPFNRAFSRITREAFLERLLLKRLGVRSLSVGEDFRFGRGAEGNAEFLSQKAKQKGFALFLVSPLKEGSQVISSTRIRHLIEKGRLREAEKMLGRPVSVYGTVKHGRGRGKSVGFPTANLNPHHETLPPPGVYAALGFLGGKKLRGMIHIGERPTFQDKEKSLEVHFLDFHRDIYGRELELIFISRLRSVRRFKDARALGQAIRKDVLKAKKALSGR